MFDLQKYTSVDRIEDLSDHMIARSRIHFKNGYELSVIKGFGSYGYSAGLFEIAIFKPNGEFTKEFYGPYPSGDVLGYLTHEEVMFYIENVGNG